jgi:parvulin-like peptidyl-prolyl isomerase
MIAALATAGQPVSGNGRQQLAQTYVDLLAYEEAARSSGIESSPEFRDLMELVRLRTLSEIHRRSLQERYRMPSPEDIDDYYLQNPSNFTDIKLRRILIPRKNPAIENQTEYEKRALQVANDLRERAAKGDDFDQLQKEGYTSLGLAAPPATDMGNRRKGNLLPENRDEILALNAGGVSKVEQEAFSFVIYKVDRKNLLPKEAVQDEIARDISRQRLENALKEIMSSVHADFNQQYFTPAPSLQPVK